MNRRARYGAAIESIRTFVCADVFAAMIGGNYAWRFFLAAVVFAFVFGGLSYLINEQWLGPEHEKYTFFRPDEDIRVTPGLGITTLIWSALITASYHFFGARISIKNRFLHGAVYGAMVYLFFIFFQELFYYQFIAFDGIIIAGALLHYFLAFTVGCGLVGAISGRRSEAEPPEGS